MTRQVTIVGAGPAGLMAAETLGKAGLRVTVYERKPSPARKFLMAGRGGLNLTHSEPLDQFMKRYDAAASHLQAAIDAFTPQNLRDWCDGLGEESFVGSSGRVFPKSFKASPLLRAWLQRLDSLGVKFEFNYDWDGELTQKPILLALGGASWPRLGSDGSWVRNLEDKGVSIAPLRPANSGFNVAWSEFFRDKFAGEPLKPVALSFGGKTQQGEIMISRNGIEGGAIYAFSSALREAAAANGSATLLIDLRPGVAMDDLVKRLSAPKARQSFPTWLRKHSGLSPAAASILREGQDGDAVPAMAAKELAARIKSFPLTLTAPFGIDRAISSAGGISFDEVDSGLMLKKLSGVFVAGEMLDWEAPTGGYLLQASFATGVQAANGIINWLEKTPE